MRLTRVQSICKIRAWLQNYWCKKTLVHRSCKESSASLEFLVLEFTGLQFPCALNNKSFTPILSAVLYYVRQCPYTLSPDFKSGMLPPITTISLKKRKNLEILVFQNLNHSRTSCFFFLDICNFRTVLHNINLKSSSASLKNK